MCEVDWPAGFCRDHSEVCKLPLWTGEWTRLRSASSYINMGSRAVCSGHEIPA